MGKGAALLPGDDGQLPRLSSVLRAVLGQPPVDVDASRLERQRALGQSSSALIKATTETGGIGQSPLPKLLFGAYDKAPKPARDEYGRYLGHVMQLLGTEVPSAELHAAAMQVWQTLAGLPAPEVARGRGPRQLLLGPHIEAVSKALGSQVDGSAMTVVYESVQALRQWQSQVGGGSSGAAGTAAGSAASSRQPAGSQPQRQEWGASLPWQPVAAPAGQAAAASAAVSWPLGPLPWVTLPAAGSGGGQQVAVGGLLGPTPEQLRAMAVGAGFGGRGGHSGHTMDAADEDDLGEEYEEGKRVREINLRWLERWAERVAGCKGPQAAEVAETAATILLLNAQGGAGAGDAIASALFDLLGFEAAEHITSLVEQRRPLLESLQLALAKIRAEDEAAGKEAVMPVYGAQVTVTSASAKARAKQERKGAKKGGRGKQQQAGDADVELLQEVGWEAVVGTEKDTGNTLILGDGLEFKIGGDGFQGRRALPAGTTRKNFKGYEEVYVPAPPRLPPPTEDELVKISDLPDWAQLAFGGFKTLNRIQSRIFKTAFTSNENLLVCAPTGAGKTNIAMITVLREVGENMKYGVIQKNDFKIVYVAPMKALAAEVTAAFSRRLAPLGLTVRELTGDMQLTKKEMAETQMIVTTPEKWDVITRKGGDVSIAALVKLLIIDEVHLLNDDRGPVIETLVARTQRQVESTQAMIRVVGLSATLPNYEDVARFLNVNLQTGLFHFDSSYRPVPLETTFVGVSVTNYAVRNTLMTEICYNKVVDSLKRGHQVMVFVHSRKDTGKTARALADHAGKGGDSALFDGREHPQYLLIKKEVSKSRNRELAELFEQGFGIHHAGMLRPDRALTERMFSEGVIKVLVCTATLAWGVNLPAHTVIIKGTQVYDAQKGTFVDLGMLDVQQIFGRAGRPQFDTSGEATIITAHNKLAHYLGMLTHQLPIESKFQSMLVDNLNAEIVLGTVTNVREAATWLSYTYLNTRMERNPLAYGLTWQDVATDPSLELYKRQLIVEAARQLKEAKMAVFDEQSGNLYVTELGRVASHFYIKQQSILTFNELLKQHMSEAQVLNMIAQSSEFESMMSREEEMLELEDLNRSHCPHDVKGVENKHGKANVLIQSYVSRARVDSFSLTADMMYVSTNAPRILRAIFEVCLRRKWSSMAETCLNLCKCLEKRLWPDSHPLRQFEPHLETELLNKLEERHLSLDMLEDMSAPEIGAAVRHPNKGPVIKSWVESFPALQLDAQLQPITRTVLRIQLSITPTFTWRDKVHGQGLRWLILVEDTENEHIYHSESWLLTKRMALEGEQKLAFTIPIFEPLPTQYLIRAISDEWLHAEATLPLSFVGLVLPDRMPPHTELLDLDPLPLSALNNTAYESMYQGRFTHFNPIQTQAFHTLYHSDEPVLLGAPTGSGKTVSSELTMLRVFNCHPDSKIIYIAPLKALVRERIEDWSRGLCRVLDKKMVELTGDYTPDLRALLAADIIICTPEKWDGISRNWQARNYVRQVGLMIIDEIHLLGADRGPILEVIVSRMRYIAQQTNRHVRFVGLSTALANAQDLADWLGIRRQGLFNFKPSVRPVPLEAHIQGYPGKFYCPRMATMNKPCYAAIQMHSPTKPVLVFVSSRRQTRLTALDLITYAVADMRPQQWLHMSEEDLEPLLMGVKDSALKHTLQFGIGLHHAGLNDRDRSLVERLFVECKIQVLVATSTLAWGVNTPAHLVVIKGTEFYDAPTKRYVDFPITDVLQMMGRAGRPQFDTRGVAVIMVHEPKKQFYKRFLYEPFPVESSLPGQLADHLNAEVVAGTITCRQDALDYLTWTYFYRRLVQNPSYYDLADTSSEILSEYLSALIEDTLRDLETAGCLVLGDEGADDEVAPTKAGRVASFYYLAHTTMTVFAEQLHSDMGLVEVLQVMTQATEFAALPVRHNEDKLNSVLSKSVRYAVDPRTLDDPHTKTNLLVQAHLSRAALPISDYITDTKSVMDNAIRVLQAMVDVAADRGWLATCLSVLHLVQCIMQARWLDDDPLLTLPHLESTTAQAVRTLGVSSLPALMHAVSSRVASGPSGPGRGAGGRGRGAGREAAVPSRDVIVDALSGLVGESKAKDIVQVCERLPIISISTQCSPAGASAGKVADSAGATQEETEERRSGQAGPGWQLTVQLTQLNGRGPASGLRPRAYTPRYPKPKDEGWFLVVGDMSTRELLALRRVGIDMNGTRGAGTATVRLSLPATNGAGRALQRVTLFLMSDSYLGLDQQLDVRLHVPVQPGGTGRHAQGVQLQVGEPLPPGKHAGQALASFAEGATEWDAEGDGDENAGGGLYEDEPGCG